MLTFGVGDVEGHKRGFKDMDSTLFKLKNGPWEFMFILSLKLHKYILYPLPYMQNTSESFKNFYHKIKEIENCRCYGSLIWVIKERR